MTLAMLLALPLAQSAQEPKNEQEPEHIPEPETPEELETEEKNERPPKPSKDEWDAMSPEERKQWRKAWRETSKYKHSGFAVPIITANAYDGVLLGLAAQYSFRPREWEYGYQFKVTLSGLVNLVPNYLNITSLVEWRGKLAWTGKIRFRAQSNYPYSGAGGANAIEVTDNESGNDVTELGYSITANSHIPGVEHLNWYAGQSLLLVGSTPATGGNLDIISPVGAFGGLIADISGGILYENTDRWPRPVEGWRAEFGIRVAMTFNKEDDPLNPEGQPNFGGLFGIFAEGIRWQPLYKDWLVLGIRGLYDMTFGPRPYFDQNRVGGIFRDELGVDQIFTGYGVYRFGGDGVINGMIELRGKIWHFDYPKFNLLLHLSAYAEEGWIFDKFDPGPHLPTVGGAFDLIFAGGQIYLRPFISAGWQTTPENPKRHAVPLFGLSARGSL